jgi:succinate-semialdehyde dehydrogenase/glutarate-semialdehyde dehydrogenase
MKNYPSLCLVNGSWIHASNGETFEVTNPANQASLGSIPSLTSLDVSMAVDNSAKAFETWRNTIARTRSDVLLSMAHLLLERIEQFASMITSEQGKPLAEARAEVTYAANYFRWFSEEAVRINGDIIPADSPTKRILVLKQPIGLVAAITPWNFPLAMLARKLAAALAAGCSFIAKPAPETPLTALALGGLALDAGLPAGVFNVVTGDAEMIGEIFMRSPLVKKVTFTGSTEVGKILIKNSAETVKKLTLELGGNAPFIVREDADLERAIEGAIYGKFRNAGQTCICVNRFLVHKNVAENFTGGLRTRMDKLVVGSGLSSDSEVGPLISEEAYAKVSRLIEMAKNSGASIILSSCNVPTGSTFFRPTIVTNVMPDMQIWNEEIFGPVCAIATFSSDEEAIALANKTPYGLAAYIYSRDLARAMEMSERLEFGMVGINDTAISSVQAPFGGIKESGFGREGSKYGVDEYLVLKYLSVQM